LHHFHSYVVDTFVLNIMLHTCLPCQSYACVYFWSPQHEAMFLMLSLWCWFSVHIRVHIDILLSIFLHEKAIILLKQRYHVNLHILYLRSGLYFVCFDALWRSYFWFEIGKKPTVFCVCMAWLGFFWPNEEDDHVSSWGPLDPLLLF
jgi:hypothetical protein